jgi:hypothetical protein
LPVFCKLLPIIIGQERDNFPQKALSNRSVFWPYI